MRGGSAGSAGSRPGRRRAALILLAVGWLAACGGSEGSGNPEGTYMRFRTDGRDFTMEGVKLLVEPFEEPGLYFLALTPEVARDLRGSAQFYMRLDDPRAFAGRTADFARMSNDVMPPTVSFELGDDVVVTQDLGSSFVIRFGAIDGEFVEGSFTGTGFTVWKLGGEDERPTEVSGTFRARVEER